MVTQTLVRNQNRGNTEIPMTRFEDRLIEEALSLLIVHEQITSRIAEAPPIAPVPS
jgi:hypothetical protein